MSKFSLKATKIDKNLLDSVERICYFIQNMNILRVYYNIFIYIYKCSYVEPTLDNIIELFDSPIHLPTLILLNL